MTGHSPDKAVDSFQWTMVQLECLKLHLKKERAHMPRELKNHEHMVLTAHEDKKLVETLIYMEHVGGGWTRTDMSDAVVTIVDAQRYINKHPTPGRPFV